VTNEVTFDYEPRPQFIPLHQRDQRWGLTVAHRRAGKTVACVNDLIARAVYSKKKNPRYAYIAPYYRQAKDVAWGYLKEYADPIASKVREAALRVEIGLNNSWITLYGADNPDAMRGLYFDGVIIDEIADCRPNLWAEIILPTLADRKGWAFFIGTPKGKNHFYDFYQQSLQDDNWFSMMLKASETGILDEDELAAMRLQMTEDQFAQEFECSFEAAVLGTYYASTLSKIESDGQITRVPHDPEFPVQVSSDLGYTDSSSYWFWQDKPDGIAIIDYEEAHSQPLSYYFNMLNTKPYKYDTIWLPHDARAKSLQTGRSTVEQFLSEEFPVRVAPKLGIQHGIDAARLVLPYCWFDKEFTRDGYEALRAYRRAYDEKRKSFGTKPMHDWASHGSDAFRIMALVCKDRIIKAPKKSEDKIFRPKGFCLEDLYTDQNAGKIAISRMRI